MVESGGRSLCCIVIPSLKLDLTEPAHFLELSQALGSLPESVLRPTQLALFDFAFSCSSATPGGRNAWVLFRLMRVEFTGCLGFCSDSTLLCVFPGKSSPPPSLQEAWASQTAEHLGPSGNPTGGSLGGETRINQTTWKSGGWLWELVACLLRGSS